MNKAPLFTGLVMLVGMTLSLADASSQPASAALKSDKDKLSYALGVMTGRTFSSHGVEIDPEVFALGFRHAIGGDKSLLSDKEMSSIIENFQRRDQQQVKKQAQSLAKRNLEKSEKFLAENKKKHGITTTNSGLQFKVIRAGNGEHPTLNDVVVVNYAGKLINGVEFDSSYKRGQPATFPVNAVIKGWQEALQLMSAGAKWEVYVPPELAYGSSNFPPMIGPNQALIFTIELVSIKNK